MKLVAHSSVDRGWGSVGLVVAQCGSLLGLRAQWLLLRSIGDGGLGLWRCGWQVGAPALGLGLVVVAQTCKSQDGSFGALRGEKSPGKMKRRGSGLGYIDTFSTDITNGLSIDKELEKSYK